MQPPGVVLRRLRRGGAAAGAGAGTRRYCCPDGGGVGTSCLLEGEERYGVVRWNGKNKMNHESAGRIDEIHNQGRFPGCFYTILCS